MIKTTSLTLTGNKEDEIELPLVFSTPFRRELIHKAWTNLNSHSFQRQGRHPTAGMDVVAHQQVKVFPELPE
jgi:large subunit ribosomal protein L4e